MCKIRQLNLGDGFPGAELGASYTPERIAAVNMISELIGNFHFFVTLKSNKNFRFNCGTTAQGIQASCSKVLYSVASYGKTFIQ